MIDQAARERVERDALRERERALLANELALGPGPYEAHVGFSNVCNMSCIMCWDGANPPPRKMSPELLQVLADQVAPSLSVITPYNGSEPLIVSWDETRRLCERHGVQLVVTTNAQFLDARHFAQLRDITETLYISIDSHAPEVFGKIRPGCRPAGVYENLRAAAPAARAHGLECIVNVVFMVENGPLLPDTMDFLADAGVEAVNVLQMLDTNGRSGLSNPLIHFSPKYVTELKQRCVAVAERRGMRLVWNVGGVEDHDFRARATPPSPRKAAYDHWDWRMRNHLPGYCRHAYDRLRIDTEGGVAPCPFTTDGELELGNLTEKPLDEMWNGARMRDLRRAHYTWDYPTICKSCRYKDPPPPRRHLPFVWDFLAAHALPGDDLDCSVTSLAPDHMTRATEPPVLSFARPRPEIDRLFMILALGGETAEFKVCDLDRDAGEGEAMDFAIPPGIWDALRPNVGWWWAVIGYSSKDPTIVVRSTEIRCVIRHQPMPRIIQGGLIYPDARSETVVDLGSTNAAGPPTSRPRIARRRTGDPMHPRKRRTRRGGARA